ncbi:hypothetical protein LY78DRAFT_124782 [Colletotrichum sublineola]|nr:hypothetical protein LY78DRAFT_124782 [Colletotrichum sublineola]
MATISVMTSGAKVFPCLMLGCTKTFSTKANLKRHHKAKHGSRYRALCGRLLHNHASNNRRHLDTCPTCKCLAQAPTTGAAGARVSPPVRLNLNPQLQHGSSWYSGTHTSIPALSSFEQLETAYPYQMALQERVDGLSFDTSFNTDYEQLQLQHRFLVNDIASEETVPEQWSGCSTGYPSGGSYRDQSLGLPEEFESASSNPNLPQLP